MRKMKDSGIEWVGNIPAHWKIKPNKKIMKKHKEICARYKNGKILSLTMDGVITRDLVNPSGKMPLSFDGYQMVRPDDLLMCLFDIDVTPRCVGVVNSEGLTSPAYSCFTMIDEVVQYYYYYYLMLDNTKELLHMSKNLRHSLTAEQLGEIKVPVPSFEEQQRIATYLDKKTSEIDTVIEKTRQSIEEYKAYKQSVITEAVTKGLDPNVPMKDSGVEWIGEIPAHWEIFKLGQLYSQVKNKNSEMRERNLLSLSYGRIIRKDINTKDGLLPESFEGYNIVEKGDIVLRMTDLQNDHTSLRTGCVNETGIITSAYITIRQNNNDYLSKYNQLYLHSFDIYKGFYGMGAGVRQGVNYDMLKKLNMLLPPYKEQKAIVNYLDKTNTAIDAIIDKKEHFITELEEYKKSLIYECVTGKREV